MASTFDLASSFFVTNGHGLVVNHAALVGFDAGGLVTSLLQHVIHFVLQEFLENDF